MSHIWEAGPKATVDRFVLLALADFCNDAGECWPSIPTLARKVRMTDRGVRIIVHRLCDEGWLAIDTAAGPKGVNLYRITPEPRSPLNTVQPEHGSLTPEPDDTRPLNGVQPNLKKNHKEPKADFFRSQKKPVSPFPPEFPYDHHAPFSENRKRLEEWKAARS